MTGERALELLQSSTVAGEGPSIDHVDDRFRLGEIETTVQEGAFGKLPRLGDAGALRQHRFQHPLRGQHTTVATDLRHIFTRVGVRAPHETEEDFVHALARAIHHKAMVYPM